MTLPPLAQDPWQYGGPNEDGTEWVDAAPPDNLGDEKAGNLVAIKWKGRQKEL